MSEQSFEQQGRSKVRLAASVSKGCMLTVEEAEALGFGVTSSDRMITAVLAAELASSWSAA